MKEFNSVTTEDFPCTVTTDHCYSSDHQRDNQLKENIFTLWFSVVESVLLLPLICQTSPKATKTMEMKNTPLSLTKAGKCERITVTNLYRIT